MFLPIPTHIVLNQFGKVYDKNESADLLTKRGVQILNTEYPDVVVVASSENLTGSVYSVVYGIFSIKNQKTMQHREIVSYFLSLEGKGFEIYVYFVPDQNNKKHKEILALSQFLSLINSKTTA